MLVEEFSSTETLIPVVCLHCGAAVRAAVPGQIESEFCCRGCSVVYSLLKERGLDQYYAIRDRAQAERTARPVSPATGGFAYLDDPEFMSAYALSDQRVMRFYLEGVHCAACIWLTEKLPEFLPGVESLRLDLSSGVATVRIREGGSFSQAAEELVRLGYRPHAVQLDESEALQKRENHRHLIQLGVAGMVTGNIMLLAIALYAGADGALAVLFRWTSFLLYLPVILYSAIPFYKTAWGSLRKRQVSVDVPIVLGLVVGTIASVVNLVLGSEHIYFDSLSTLIFLMLSTRYLLRKVNHKAFQSSRLMHFLAPSTARKWNPVSRVFEEVKTHSIGIGDRIQVLPGECFPADGTVLNGESRVNCALLTGESDWVKASRGTRVSAGTWNQAAPLEFEVVASGASTRLGKIVAAMEAGLASKAPIVTTMDRVGQGFVGAVLVLTAIGFFIGLSDGWHEAVNRALAVAIVVCPCTFALATPLALSLAMGKSAKNGLLIKGAEVLERLSHIQHAFFDKTGTLTFGDLRVVDWNPLEPSASQALLALELRSAHPIAKAVQRHFADRVGMHQGIVVDSFNEVAGVGVSGVMDGSLYELRSLVSPETARRPAQVGTQVELRRDGLRVGVLELADEIRPDSRDAIAQLSGLGIQSTILSGDAPAAVAAVAQQLGIAAPRTTSLASPEQKSQIVKASPKSLMVGDGANDAIALASAYASVAVQGGMEMSMRAAGVYSSVPGILPIVTLLKTARQTMRVIHRNLVFAILYNIVGLGFALTGHLNPLVAAILMPLSALTVFVSTIVGSR